MVQGIITVDDNKGRNNKDTKHHSATIDGEHAPSQALPSGLYAHGYISVCKQE